MSRLTQAAAVFAAGFIALQASTQDAQAQDDLTARDIGEVVTADKWVGPDHTVQIVAFNDPEVEGVTCHLSRPVTGGLSGLAGMAEEKSDASIACRQTGPITVTGDLDPDGEEVFNEDRSLWFKALRVHRFFDEEANTLVYLTTSKKLFDGSPKNSLSTVVAMPWYEDGQFTEPDMGLIGLD
jgi:CreA protein